MSNASVLHNIKPVFNAIYKYMKKHTSCKKKKKKSRRKKKKQKKKERRTRQVELRG